MKISLTSNLLFLFRMINKKKSQSKTKRQLTPKILVIERQSEPPDGLFCRQQQTHQRSNRPRSDVHWRGSSPLRAPPSGKEVLVPNMKALDCSAFRTTPGRASSFLLLSRSYPYFSWVYSQSLGSAIFLLKPASCVHADRNVLLGQSRSFLYMDLNIEKVRGFRPGFTSLHRRKY